MDAVDDFADVHGVIAHAGNVVGLIRVAIPAMFRAISIFHFAAVRRIGGGVQDVFQVVHAVIQEIGVRAADVDVKLAFES